MSLIGQTQNFVFKQIQLLGYNYRGLDVDFYTFTKQEEYGTSELTVSFKNRRCNTVGWNLFILFTSKTMRDVLSSGFKPNEKVRLADVQAFKHDERGLVLTIFDRSYENKIIVNLGRMSNEQLGSLKTDGVSKHPEKPKAVFRPQTYPQRYDVPFQGTKSFCSEDDRWSYNVTILKDSVTLKLYPGKNNNYFKDKTEVREIIKGVMVNYAIVTNKYVHYLDARLKFENDKLLEKNDEGRYNEFEECR